MFDLILRGGSVVDTDAVRPLDLAIDGGKIAARLAPGEPAQAVTVLDVSGLLLMPGLVDAHVHLREPGMTWKEDFASGTRAAAAGGVTTVLVMPTDDPWTVSTADFTAKQALAQGRIACDVGLQVAVSGDGQDLAELRRLGATSFEIFTSDVQPQFLHGTTRSLHSAIAAVAAAGGTAAVSSGDQSLLEAAVAGLVQGRSTPADFIASRSALAEAQGIARVILAAADVGVPVHIRQTSSRQSVDTYRRLRDLADVSIETGVQGLLFTQADYARLGPMAKASPPWRAETDRDALRAALADGTIDMVVTDHAPHLLQENWRLPTILPLFRAGSRVCRPCCPRCFRSSTTA